MFDNTAAPSPAVVGGLIFCISATPHLGTSFPLFHEGYSHTVFVSKFIMQQEERSHHLAFAMCPSVISSDTKK